MKFCQFFIMLPIMQPDAPAMLLLKHDLDLGITTVNTKCLRGPITLQQ